MQTSVRSGAAKRKRRREKELSEASGRRTLFQCGLQAEKRTKNSTSRLASDCEDIDATPPSIPVTASPTVSTPLSVAEQHSDILVVPPVLPATCLVNDSPDASKLYSQLNLV